MGKKINDAFLSAYKELENACLNKFGIEREGIGEYINNLSSHRKGARRDVALSHLVKYRRIKGDIDSGANLTDKIRRTDIAWLDGFRRDIEHNRDPIALSLRKSKRIADMLKHKILKIILPIIALILLCVAVIILAVVLANQ